MKGWRLSAWPKLETGSSLVKRAYFCRTSDRSPCLFLLLGPRAHDPRICRRQVSRFRAHRAPRPRSRTNSAQASAIMKTAPALHPRSMRPEKPETKKRRKDSKPGFPRHGVIPGSPRTYDPGGRSDRESRVALGSSGCGLWIPDRPLCGRKGMTRDRWPSFRAGRSAERKKGPGGRRKPLKRLDPDKEIKVNSFDFLWPGFAG